MRDIDGGVGTDIPEGEYSSDFGEDLEVLEDEPEASERVLRPAPTRRTRRQAAPVEKVRRPTSAPVNAVRSPWETVGREGFTAQQEQRAQALSDTKEGQRISSAHNIR